MIPPGLTRCESCGEFRGTFYFSEPDAPEALNKTEVSCSCEGILCRCCAHTIIRRPISDRWDERNTRIIHTPWFGGYFPCADCRAAGQRACL